ncbi:MAG: hypothetical protein FWD13_11315 [Treponema sp.]|nr:hypothetical protein [Treponema sp.]
MYSVESVITALKENELLSCEGIDSLGCPSPVNNHGCKGEPENCNLCLNQSCKQPVSVHNNFRKLIVLNFRYMISPGNHNGFIRKDDSALKKLISHKLINTNLLKSALK